MKFYLIDNIWIIFRYNIGKLGVMKTVISEGNLSGYYSGDISKLDIVDISKLNIKIKSIKTALKIAQKHNQQLHNKLKNEKDNHQIEIIQYETEYKRYKQLYQMLLEDYQIKNLELKQYKKKLKRIELNSIKSINLDNSEQVNREYKENILNQQKEIFRLKQENRLLYQQVSEKNSKIRQIQNFISQNIHGSRAQPRDRSFQTNIKRTIEFKNDELEKAIQEKCKLMSIKHQLQKENNDFVIKLTKISTELQYEKRTNQQLKQKNIKHQKDICNLSQQTRTVNTKYQQLLNFSYQNQKDLQKELYSISKQIFKKDSQK